MRHKWLRASPTRGFTLIELMIVVGVAALLVTIALPSYQDTTRKSRRSEAVTALAQLQQAQERYRAGNTGYAANLADLPGSQPSATSNYNLAIDASGNASYTLTASAKPASPQFGDLKCRGLRVRAASGVIYYESLDAANAVDAANANRCWAR